jgi:uncharacterized protein YukE
MQQTSLTQAQAQAKINQVDEAMDSARQLANNMQVITNEMKTSWMGNQSQKFGQKMQQYDDEFRAIINRLTQIADTGTQNMKTVFYTKRGRIVAAPSDSPSGELWTTLKTGSDHTIGQAVAQLIGLSTERWEDA